MIHKAKKYYVSKLARTFKSDAACILFLFCILTLDYIHVHVIASITTFDPLSVAVDFQGIVPLKTHQFEAILF